MSNRVFDPAASYSKPKGRQNITRRAIKRNTRRTRTSGGSSAPSGLAGASDLHPATPRALGNLKHYSEAHLDPSQHATGTESTTASDPAASAMSYQPEMGHTVLHSSTGTGWFAQSGVARSAALGLLRGTCNVYNPMRNSIRKSLKYNIKQDPRIVPLLIKYFAEVRAPCTARDEDIETFVNILQESYFSRLSFLYSARRRNADAASLAKYRDLASWFPPGGVPTEIPRPLPWKILFSLPDMYIIKAINTCCNSHIHKRHGAEPPKAAKTYPPYERWRYVTDKLEEYLQAYDRRYWWSLKTTNGFKVTTAISQAIAIVRDAKNNIFQGPYFNFEELIPIGANIAYDFYGGALHHAIYVGNKYVVEVLGYNDVPTGIMGYISARLKTYVTLTHIYEFLERALVINMFKDASAIIMRPFENPYPDSVIVSRAINALGEYPGYDFMNENCETFCLWTHTNNWDTVGECLTTKTRLAQDAAGLLSLTLLATEGPHGVYSNTTMGRNVAAEEQATAVEIEMMPVRRRHTGTATRAELEAASAAGTAQAEANLGKYLGGRKRRTRRLHY